MEELSQKEILEALFKDPVFSGSKRLQHASPTVKKGLKNLKWLGRGAWELGKKLAPEVTGPVEYFKDLVTDPFYKAREEYQGVLPIEKEVAKLLKKRDQKIIPGSLIATKDGNYIVKSNPIIGYDDDGEPQIDTGWTRMYRIDRKRPKELIPANKADEYVYNQAMRNKSKQSQLPAQSSTATPAAPTTTPAAPTPTPNAAPPPPSTSSNAASQTAAAQKAAALAAQMANKAAAQKALAAKRAAQKAAGNNP